MARDVYFEALKLRVERAITQDDLWVGTIENSFARIDTDVKEVASGVYVVHAEDDDGDLHSYAVRIEPLGQE